VSGTLTPWDEDRLQRLLLRVDELTERVTAHRAELDALKARLAECGC
jgi:uncharacterized small protein (DUF1192 family)